MTNSPSRWRPAVALAALLLAPAAGQAQEPKPLLWGADAEGGAPYILEDPNDPDRLVGFEVELIEALAREVGRPVRFKQYDFKNLMLGLQRGDFDLAMNGLEVTPDRQDKARFTKPYYVFKLQLLVRAGETRVRSVHDCRRLGLAVGVLEETSAERLLDRWGVKKVAYDSQVNSFQDLENGNTDAVLVDLPPAAYYVRNNPRLKAVEPPVGGKGYYAIAFRKADEALAAQFDAALDRLLEKGELRRIYAKWNVWNDSQEELLPPNAFYEPGEEETADTRQEGWSFWVTAEKLWYATGWTVLITFLSMPVAVALGMPIALARLYGAAPLRWLAVAYVEFFRGIPVLLLLYFLYFALPSVGEALGLGGALKMSPLAAAVLGLGMNYAAYEAEIYRAAIGAIPEGQWEAAASLGMSPGLTFRRVILPQAVRGILPPSTSDFVALFKDSSLAGVITLVELSKRFQITATSGASYAQIAEVGALTAALYLLLSLPLGWLSRYLETKWET